MPLNIENDFDILDGLEEATTIQAGTGFRTLSRRAFVSPVTVRDAILSDGTYRQGDAKFVFPAADFPGPEPSAGDFIEDKKGVLWAVATVESIAFRTQFRLWARSVSLNPNAAVDLNVYFPKFVKDETGAASIDWKLFKQMKGYVNESVSKIEIEADRKRVTISHQIYFTDEGAVGVQAGWQVRDGQGGVWNVARVTNKGNMGQATILDVETARTPVND